MAQKLIDNTLLVHWNVSPTLEARVHDKFPIPDNPELREAFHNGQIDYAFLEEKLGKEFLYWRGNKFIEFREKLICAESAELTKALQSGEDPIKFNLYALDSYTFQAIVKKDGFPHLGISNISKEGKIYSRLGIFAFTLSPDRGQVIFGVRGGTNLIGRINPSPMGHPKFYEITDPIRKGIIEEGMEEQGVLESEIEDLSYIGAFKDNNGFPGEMFVCTEQLNIPVAKVIRRHSRAMQLYNFARRIFPGSNCNKEVFARTIMSGIYGIYQRFPRDAWENERLKAYSNDPDELISQFITLAQQNKPVLSMYGAFALYVLHEHGEEYYNKLIRNEAVRARVDDKILKKY